jgi:ATP-dependent DNA helicase PIF1
MVTFSKEQDCAYKLYKDKKNVFVTGPGGSGKSELIRNIYKDAIAIQKNIKVTSLTGASALLLECKATTIHSFFGIGSTLKGSINYLTNRALLKKRVKTQLNELDILVVDEISMMSGKLFDLLDSIARKARKNDSYFGGLQLIFSGDFYQLPPIGEDEYTKQFCFESLNWDAIFGINIVILKRVFRQKDNEYIKILNQIRKGKISRKSYEILLNYVGRKYNAETDKVPKPIQLYPRKRMVENVNSRELNMLVGKEYKYILEECSSYSSIYPEEEVENEKRFLLNSVSCEKELLLKVGCRVLCIVNLDLDGELPICNGSAGKVTRIDESNGYPYVKFTNGSEILMGQHEFISENIKTISIKQIPLILAYSISIHRSQGCGFKSMEVDIGDSVFEEGQTYVALSRLKDLSGLYIKSLDLHKIKANVRVTEFYKKHGDI